MANIDRPNGYRPVGNLTGTPYGGPTLACVSTENLFLGDLVKWASDPLAGASGAGAYLDVDRVSGVADLVVGVVVGWQADPSVDLSRKYYTGGSGGFVQVAPIDGLLLEVQCDDNAMTLVKVGLNADTTFAAGSLTTGMSNMELDSSTLATSNLLQFKVMGVAAIPGSSNEFSSAWTRVIVKCNQSGLNDQTAGV